MSSTLTAGERSFLRKYNIEKTDLYNAKGAGPSVYRPIMKATGKLIAYNVLKPCRRGHGLRTRVGACPQCEPKQLHFLRRHGSAGTVYVARSRQRKLVKVGMVETNISKREGSINRDHYGGATDWKMVASFNVAHRVGDVENHAHKLLKKYAVTDTAYRDGNVIAGELFSCAAKHAIAALEAAVKAVIQKKSGSGRSLRLLRGTNIKLPTPRTSTSRVATKKLSKRASQKSATPSKGKRSVKDDENDAFQRAIGYKNIEATIDRFREALLRHSGIYRQYLIRAFSSAIVADYYAGHLKSQLFTPTRFLDHFYGTLNLEDFAEFKRDYFKDETYDLSQLGILVEHRLEYPDEDEDLQALEERIESERY